MLISDGILRTFFIRKVVASCVAGILGVVPSKAETWRWVAEAQANGPAVYSDYGFYQVFVDVDSIKEIGRNRLRQALVMYSYNKPQPNEGRNFIYSRRIEVEVDCSSDSLRIISKDDYSEPLGRGEKLNSQRMSGSFERLTEGSVSDFIAEEVCER